MAPPVGLEPTTLRLTAACSTSVAATYRQAVIVQTIREGANIGYHLIDNLNFPIDLAIGNLKKCLPCYTPDFCQ